MNEKNREESWAWALMRLSGRIYSEDRRTTRVGLRNSEQKEGETLRTRDLVGEPGSIVSWTPSERKVPGRSVDGVSITEPSKNKDHWL